MNFFDSYPQFYETSRTGPVPNRLNKRYKAIFETEPSIYQGARVLDISSHDGRWSFAALSKGARHVTGIEPRKHLVDNANKTLSEIGCDRSTYDFIQGDVFEVLKPHHRFDVVLCLGFFYHTYRHPDLMRLIKTCDPKVVVVDSQVANMPGRLCAVRADETHNEYEAFSDPSSYKGRTLVAMPTLDLLQYLFTLYDFEVATVDWQPIIGDGPVTGVKDYKDNERATIICRAK